MEELRLLCTKCKSVASQVKELWKREHETKTHEILWIKCEAFLRYRSNIALFLHAMVFFDRFANGKQLF